MIARPGKFAIFEQFAADGITKMFGNPGTSEEGFLDVVSQRGEMDYVLTLQETVAIGVADGYARASGRPALVQLHAGVGLGNGIGMMYQALRGHSPLVVIAGEAGLRYEALDAQMAADLVSMARPVTKWATRVVDPGSVLRVLRRAVKIAMTHPRGPVFVDLPLDLLDLDTLEPAVPSTIPSQRVVPAGDDLGKAVDILRSAQRPLIIIGDDVSASGAQAELTAVAELLNAPVWGACDAEANMDATHPLYQGQLGHMFGEDSQRRLEDADAVLIVGTYVFPEVFPLLNWPFRPGARIVHIDLDTYEIGKNFPVNVALAADPKATLAVLADASSAADGQEDHPVHGETRHRRRHQPAPAADAPLIELFAAELARQSSSNLVVFDEALTASASLAAYLPATTPGSFHATRGGSLGVGIPGAIGVKIARPDAASRELLRRRRQHVHLPGAVDRRAPRRPCPVRDLQQPSLPDPRQQHRQVLVRAPHPGARIPGFLRPVPPGDRLRRPGQVSRRFRRTSRQARTGRGGGDEDARAPGTVPRRSRHGVRQMTDIELRNGGQLTGMSVAVLMESDYVEPEIDYYLRRFAEEGARTVLLTRLWGQHSLTFHGHEYQIPITVDGDLEAIDDDRLREFDALIVPAGMVSDRLRYTDDVNALPPAVKLLRRAFDMPELLKGIICHGMWLVAPIPEVIRGRRITCHNNLVADVRNMGAIYTDQDVVVEGDLVTGRSAHHCHLFGRMIIDLLAARNGRHRSAVGAFATAAGVADAKVPSATPDSAPASAQVNRIEFPFSDMVAGYVTGYDTAQRTIGLATGDGRPYRVTLTDTTNAEFARNLGDPYADASGRLDGTARPRPPPVRARRLLPGGRRERVRGPATGVQRPGLRRVLLRAARLVGAAAQGTRHVLPPGAVRLGQASRLRPSTGRCCA